eukprot:7382413-Prymnesium_polylepis.1
MKAWAVEPLFEKVTSAAAAGGRHQQVVSEPRKDILGEPLQKLTMSGGSEEDEVWLDHAWPPFGVNLIFDCPPSKLGCF